MALDKTINTLAVVVSAVAVSHLGSYKSTNVVTDPLKKTDVVSPAGLWLLRIALHLPLPPHGLHRHNQSPSRYP